MTTDPAPDVATVVGGKMSPSPVELPESTPSSPVLATPARDREVYPRGVTELTPELRAALPTSPLASWSARDVAACARVLGREFAREEGESRSGDVEAFDRYADTFLAHGIDGEKLSCVTIAQLSGDLGVRSYEHRFKVVEWVKRYLEVRSPPTFPRLPTSRRSSTLAARDERFLGPPRESFDARASSAHWRRRCLRFAENSPYRSWRWIISPPRWESWRISLTRLPLRPFTQDSPRAALIRRHSSPGADEPTLGQGHQPHHETQRHADGALSAGGNVRAARRERVRREPHRRAR